MRTRPDLAGTGTSRGAVLVLGASRGLGRAIAIATAEEGFPVVLGCRHTEDGQATVRQLQALGHRARSVSVDVADYAAVEAAVEMAAQFGPGLAGVVNNAGIVAPLGPLDVTDPAAWSRAIEVNLVGAYNGTRAALSRLGSDGVIINLSSGAAHVPVEGWSAYCVAKAGLAMLTRCTHAEHGSRLRIYGVQPGMVDTDMQAEIRSSGIGAPSRVPRHSLSQATLPARAIAWLLRQAPGDLSGREVDLDSIPLHPRLGREDNAR